ncbi:hypothetical protein FQN53_001637 [Emmonsiellopsis sp. PD_33]|nr:hypothetical protein FQN53_001637 [Emmonsiellopsis sp. PD_33]
MTKSISKNVAVIGAGISGVVAAAHLKQAGVSVVVFERSKEAGGVWVYDKRPPIEPQYPATKPSEGELFPSGNEEDEADKDLRHAPPGPCYEGLTNNIPTPLVRTKLNAWPDGTPDFVSHRTIKEYIQDTSKKAGVAQITLYNTRVFDVQKIGSQWKVKSLTLKRDVQSGRWHELQRVQSFDAVVVASGHYHAPLVPGIPGLSEWKRQWPGRVSHSKSYRRPDDFKGMNVLLIGAGVSSTDIAKELGGKANKIYQSSRGGNFDLPASFLPPNGFRVGEISSFNYDPDSNSALQDLGENQAIPFLISLKSGHELCDIHRVIVCTGYHITYPFLNQYHEDDTAVESAGDTVLVTDGTQLHNLHKDIFYIPDPSLAFIGAPYFTATFTLFEFQAIAVAAVLSGRANLPSLKSMRDEYRERVKAKGFGRGFHSLRDGEVEYVNDLIGWINVDSARHGYPPVEGHSALWLKLKESLLERIQQRFEEKGPNGDVNPGTLASLQACNET